MSNVPTNFVYNSITNQIVDEEKRDLDIPFTLLNFLKYNSSSTNELNDIALYQDYIQKWRETTTKQVESAQTDIRNQFIVFLKEIRLQFLNKEEQRYLDNINFDDNQELSVAIPFFATKLKDISLYYKGRRDAVGSTLETIKRKGSLQGLRRFLKDELGNIYSGEDQPDGLNIPDDIPEYLKNLDIDIDPVYDDFNDYYDLDPSKSPSYYNTISGDRFDYFTTNTNNISAHFYVDTAAAINDVINNNGIQLEEVPGLLIKFNTSDLSFTQSINYETYKNTGLSGNLSFLKQRDIAASNMGTDMYYVSTNNFGDYVYEKLFDAKQPQRNLLNINHPSTIQVPGNKFVTGRDVGLYFNPVNRGLLSMNTEFTNILVKSDLRPETVYVFPDPNSYGNIDGVGVGKRENPVTFTIRNTIRKNTSSAFGSNLPKSTYTNQNFHSYTTREQFNTNINNLSALRTIQSLTSAGFIVKEAGDIFGNRFYHFNTSTYTQKNISSTVSDNLALGPELLYRGDDGLDALQTVINTLSTSSEKEPITFIRNKLKPIIIYNLKKNVITELNEAFATVFDRYIFNQELYHDVSNNQIADINIFKNTYFFRTSGFYVIDTVDYNIDTGEFEPSTFISSIKPYNRTITTEQDIRPISNISNPYEVNGEIFYIEVKSANYTNARPVNISPMSFNIFKYDRVNKREVNLVTSDTAAESFFADNFTFDVGSNITQITDVELKFNSKQNKFNCISNFRDLNNVSYIHVLTFKIKGNLLTVFDNYVIKPTNFSSTRNFYKVDEFMTNFKTISGAGNIAAPRQKVTDGTLRL